MERHILAISGGGFSEVKNALIDTYLLKLKRQERPLNIAFIATASNDAQGYIEKFYEAFANEHPSHITIQDFTQPDIQNYVNSLDILYVGGGNTSYLLKTWKETGFDEVVKQAYENGVILAGISAGAMCWFEHCYTQIDGDDQSVEGLGILKGAFLPHANKYSACSFEAWGHAGNIAPLYALEDEETIHFVNERHSLKLVERMNNGDTV